MANYQQKRPQFGGSSRGGGGGGGRRKTGLDMKEDRPLSKPSKQADTASGAGRQNYTMFPGTAKQLSSATSDARGTLTISGQLLTHVTIVGKVVAIEDVGDNTCAAFRLSDETGEIAVRLLTNYDVTTTPDPNIQPNKVVRVFGSLRSPTKQAKDMYINAYQVRLADAGEQLFHKAEAEVHRRRQAGTLPPNNNSSNQANLATPSTASAAQKPATEAIHAAVMAALEHGRSSDAGMTVEDICKRDPKISPADALAATNHLAQEGSIYATTDEHHFKLTV